jgi:quercetin dioxygenase-like cupin family protein
VWFEPGERHWHSASPTTAMTHIAIAEIARRQSGRVDGTRNRPRVRRLTVKSPED